MPTEVIMPQMGFDMTQGTLVRWLKTEGESVERGEAIAEIETDKAIVSIEAFASGVMGRLVAQEGDVVPVGQVIAYIVEPGEAPPSVEARPQAVAAAPGQAPPSMETRPQVAAAAPPPPPPAVEVARPVREEIVVSPRARRLAAQEGVDLGPIRGSGPGGRIVEDDIRRFVAQRQQEQAATAPPPPPTPGVPPAGAVPLTPMRAAIARRMSQSKKEIPHFYLTTNVDMSAAQRWRTQWNQAHPEAHLTLTDLVAHATVQALKKFPQLNASFSEEGITIHPQINLGLAIALEQGLVAPAMVDCGEKSLVDLAQAARDLADRAKAGVLRAEEYAGATFTLTNLGMYDVESFIAIINPPQAAILAVGSVRRVPMVRGDGIFIAEVMKATISGDHRVTDGAYAAQFLIELKSRLENP